MQFQFLSYLRETRLQFDMNKLFTNNENRCHYVTTLVHNHKHRIIYYFLANYLFRETNRMIIKHLKNSDVISEIVSLYVQR